MSIEKTLSIIKPDAVKRNIIGKVIAKIEEAGLRIIAQKRIILTELQASSFYKIHEARPFFGSLVKQMTSGPVIVQIIEGENAIIKYREIMGSTDPKMAAESTIRREFGESIEANIVHGSDSRENALIETNFFFSQMEITG